MATFCSYIWSHWIIEKSKISDSTDTNTKNVHHWCGRNSSVESSAPTILWPRIQIPSTSTTFFKFILFKLYICHWKGIVKRTKIKKKWPELANFFQKNCRSGILLRDVSIWANSDDETPMFDLSLKEGRKEVNSSYASRVFFFFELWPIL